MLVHPPGNNKTRIFKDVFELTEMLAGFKKISKQKNSFKAVNLAYKTDNRVEEKT